MNRTVYVDTEDMGRIRCDYEASELIYGADCINEALFKVRRLLAATYPKTQTNGIEYELYVYESEEVNAFSKREGSGYVIAFSTAMFVKFFSTVKNLFLDSAICEWFGTTPGESARCVNVVYDYMVWFIAYHEFFHVCNGHCDYSSFRNILNMEKISERNETENLFVQIMEGDADYSATCACVNFIFVQAINAGAYDDNKESEFRNKILNYSKAELIFLGLAIYQVFLLFSDEERGNMQECVNNLLKYDHPYASIRLVYSCIAMTYQIGIFLPEEDVKKLLLPLFEICIAYDRIFYAKENFANSLLSLAFTKKGMQHIMFIHNECNNMYDELIKYAHLKLEKRKN